MSTSLTPEQWAQVEEDQKHWHQVSLNTDPADFETADHAIRALYRMASLTEPPRTVRVASTAGANVAIWLLSNPDGEWFKQEASKYSVVNRYPQGEPQGPSAAFDAALNTSLYSMPYRKGSNARSAQDELNVTVAVKYGVKQGTTLQDTLATVVKKANIRPSYNYFAASFDAHWLGFYDSLRNMDFDFTDQAKAQLTEWITLVNSAGWWWPFDEVVIIADRPAEIHVEQQPGSTMLRLHNADGPSLRYRDGWKKYTWHGTDVPESSVTEGWGVEQILSERNTEVRRAVIEMRGWDRFVVDAGLTMVDECDDPGNPGFKIGLYDLGSKLRDLFEEPARILLCTNGTVERDGTRRRFGLVCPANHTKALNAAADLYDVPPELYAKMQYRK